MKEINKVIVVILLAMSMWVVPSMANDLLVVEVDSLEQTIYDLDSTHNEQGEIVGGVEGNLQANDTLEMAAVKVEEKSNSDAPKVYAFPIKENIMPSAVRLTDKCLNEALEMDVDYVIIDLNTYGGLVDAADSIRTRILNYPKPIYVFVNNQAASAGALIAIAADRIYMRSGASMGAATVVAQDGMPVPDKYQSFMRGMMRSTAESHGKVVDKIVRGDTIWRWYRDPKIAESMVDPSIVVEGLVEEGKVLTFSTEEAMEWHYCEGKAASIEEVLALAEIGDYQLTIYEPTAMDKILGFLTNPLFQGLMIMLIIGGIYFELQTPGIGLPAILAVTGALLYFAPLYLEGLLANWELIVFIIGVILIILEIFVTPGFGVLGIAGIVAVILGLAFAMIDTDLLKYIPDGQLPIGIVVKPVALVIISVTLSFLLSIALGRKILIGQSAVQRKIVLNQDMSVEEGYVSHREDGEMEGKTGVASTWMRPAGKVLIDGRLYEATGADGQFIERGRSVVVVKRESGILYCREVEQE